LLKNLTVFTGDTIAALSTSFGHSGIGIVRLSGKNAIRITEKIFVSPHKKPLSLIPSHRILYGHIVSPESEVIDEVLVSIMRAPKTYTREDVVEINCHGGPVPLQRVLEIVLKYGARLADPGEFTRRAFENGRIDLAQAEAVLDIINAMTEQGQRAAVEQLSGSLSKKVETLRREILELTAFIEAHIDFPEEDIEPMKVKDIQEKALTVKRSLEKFIESSRYGVILREGIKTAIIGRPNVGKSSLLNALLEQERAIVTEVPGTTRDIIEDYVNIQGLPIRIMDTAGIRSVEGSAEKEGVKRSIKAMAEADLILIVLDGSERLQKTDRELIEQSNPQNTILVINKSDLPQELELEASDRRVVKVSAIHETGLDDLKTEILNTTIHGKSMSGSGLITNVRHVQALEKALVSMNSFIEKVLNKTSPEFLAVELRDALDAMGAILGITTPEDILDTIFDNFCIGK
jgi:tRNA modification GTPase